MNFLPIIGSLVSAYGAIQQGQMTSQSLLAQADLQEKQANEARTQGQFNATKQQLIANQKIGTSTAAYGASGVDINTSGSVGEVLRSSAQNAELDRLNILHGADVRAINFENQASLNKYAAASAVQGSYWNALGSLSQGMIKSYANSKYGGGSGEGAGLNNDSYDAEAAVNAEDAALATG